MQTDGLQVSYLFCSCDEKISNFETVNYQVYQNLVSQFTLDIELLFNQQNKCSHVEAMDMFKNWHLCPENYVK